MIFQKEFKEIPESYRTSEAEKKGKVERVDYKTTNYDGRPMDKHCYVYTPYGYDENKEYEILYYLHGGGETAEKYLFENGEENVFKRMVDHMIENGDINPIVICTPCMYPDNTVVKMVPGQPSEPVPAFVRHFPIELTVDLMPAVESKYATYAKKDVSSASLMNSREHRAFIGWSLGSTTSWTVFLQCPEYFNRAGILSGALGCPILNNMGDIEDYHHRSVNEMVKLFKKQNRTYKDFFLFMCTGTKDQCYPNLDPMVKIMKEDYSEYFRFDGEEQNTNYLLCEDGEHHTPWRLLYTYNEVEAFFRK